MFQKDSKILFIGAHPDDIELGAGGTLSKLVCDGNEVICATLSHNIRTNGKEKLPEQNKKSLKTLGVKEKNILIENFNSRHFHEHRQEITDYFCKLKDAYSPDVVFVHNPHDLHRDHKVVSEEAMRPFRDVSLLNYEVNRSTIKFEPHLFVEISKDDLDRKVKALNCYDIYKGRNYLEAKSLEATSSVRGIIIEKPLVEAFEVVKIIG